MRASTARPYNQTLNSLDFSLEKFGDVLLDLREHTDPVGCVGRQLPEVVSAVGVALDDSGGLWESSRRPSPHSGSAV